MSPNQPDASHTLHRLLFRALLELRTQGHEDHNKVVFHLADLFHTIILDMERAARGECSYDDVMRELRQLADEKGLRRWLDHNLAELTAAPGVPGPNP